MAKNAVAPATGTGFVPPSDIISRLCRIVRQAGTGRRACGQAFQFFFHRIGRLGKPRQQVVQHRDDKQSQGGGENKDRKSTRLNSSHVRISYAVFCLKKKTNRQILRRKRCFAQSRMATSRSYVVVSNRVCT